MLRRLILTLVLAALPLGAGAQDRSQTLADLKRELTLLMADFNALKGELITSGAAATGARRTT